MILKDLIITLSLIVVFYAMWVFVSLEPDFREWDEGGRVLYVYAVSSFAATAAWLRRMP